MLISSNIQSVAHLLTIFQFQILISPSDDCLTFICLHQHAAKFMQCNTIMREVRKVHTVTCLLLEHNQVQKIDESRYPNPSKGWRPANNSLPDTFIYTGSATTGLN